MLQSEFQIPNTEHANVLTMEAVRSVEVFDNKPEQLIDNQTELRQIVENAYEHKNVIDISERLNNQKKLSQSISISEEIGSVRNDRIESAIDEELRQKQILKLMRDMAAVLFSKDASDNQSNLSTEKALKNEEAIVGSGVFGPLAPNETKRFFFFDRKNDSGSYSWFFYSQIVEPSGNKKDITLHFEVDKPGVKKIDTLDGINYSYISGKEFDYFTKAVEIYHKRVMHKVYKRPIDELANKKNINPDNQIAA
jgi:hypothetical protein